MAGWRIAVRSRNNMGMILQAFKRLQNRDKMP
jgi:hypothetical protein